MATTSPTRDAGVQTSVHDSVNPIIVSCKGRSFVLRQMEAEDIPAAVRIQCKAYPSHFHEKGETIEARRAAYPQGSIVAVDEKDGAANIVGYAQFYPWVGGTAGLEQEDAPAIIKSASDAGSTLVFLHEITLEVQGTGLGMAIMDWMLRVCRERGFKEAKLVAVLGNEKRWESFGFRRDYVFEGGYAAQHGITTSVEGAVDGVGSVVKAGVSEEAPDVAMSMML